MCAMPARWATPSRRSRVATGHPDERVSDDELVCVVKIVIEDGEDILKIIGWIFRTLRSISSCSDGGSQ
jgi:hypothetical protein